MTDERVLLRQRAGSRWPVDVACGPAFLGPLVACVVLGSWAPAAVELAVLAVLVAVVSRLAAAAAGLVAVGTSLLSYNAFHENALGVLAVHPRVDGPVAVLLLAAWVLGRAA